jgi:hypothetical protein
VGTGITDIPLARRYSALQAMDIISHALWTVAAATSFCRRTAQPIKLRWAAFWGIFPDVFSFAIPAVVRIWWYATGVTPSLLPDAKTAGRFQFVWQLYHGSHSLIIFSAVFGIVWIAAKRPIVEMLGWALHILIDIPTHQGIFAIRFLWPLSSYGFSGLRWENRWFTAVNYVALLFCYVWIWITRRMRATTEVRLAR